jgi:hypothetical protein
MAVDLNTYGGDLLPAGFPGAIVDTNPTTIESKTNSAAVAIDFGVAVARSTTDDTCKAPAADGDKIIGISVRLATKVATTNNTVVNYAQYDVVPILKEGYIYATAFENATRGDGVISVTAQNGKLGSTTGGAAGAGRVAVPGAVWETTTTAGQVGKIRIVS